MPHDKPPKKPHILGPEFIKTAKGADLIHSLPGEEAMNAQIAKGPEGRKRTLKDIKSFINKIFEKETIVTIYNDKLLFKYDVYISMYENKAKLLNQKENLLYILSSQLEELNEKIKATREVDDYIKNNKPELYAEEHKKMDLERARITEEETALLNKIEKHKNNIRLDKKGLDNLQKKIVEIVSKDDNIQIEKQ